MNQRLKEEVKLILRYKHCKPQVLCMSGLNQVPHLAESGVLHCYLAEEKVHIVPVLNSVEEMGLCGRKEEKIM